MKNSIFQKSRISSLERKVAVMNLVLRGCQKNLDSLIDKVGALAVGDNATLNLIEGANSSIGASIEKQKELIEAFNSHIRYHREYSRSVCGLIIVMVIVIVLLVADIALLRERLKQCELPIHTEQVK